jgi:hypothetical protein
MEQLRRKKYKLKNHKTTKMEQLRRKKYNQRCHMTLEEGIKKKKKRGNSRIGNGGGYSSTKRLNT